MTRYCVIGAGAAGISALQQLLEAGHEVDCYEKTDRVGGHWHTDYEALHLITSRDTTTFKNFPMPPSYPHFPRRDQIRAYIESYAQANGHYELITFDTAVESVEPVPGEPGERVGSRGWRVVTSRAHDTVYDGVLIANGHLWDPKIPPISGEFTGVQLHSSEYNNVSDLEGDRILVVGAGNSGCDLAVDVAQHRLEADIVMQEGIFFQPKSYFGVPRSQLAFLSDFAPAEQDLINRLMARLAIGEWSDYPGMPEPKAKTLAEGSTTVNNLLLYWIQHGRVTVRPGIERFDGTTVHFVDGTTGEYDSILWATGFNVKLSFLNNDLITWQNNVPLRYAAGILPEGVEKLYFIGLTAPRGPQIPIYGQQAKVAAQMIALHEAAGPAGADLGEYMASMQDGEVRIDMVRDVWLEQFKDTERLLQAFATARSTPATHAESEYALRV